MNKVFIGIAMAGCLIACSSNSEIKDLRGQEVSSSIVSTTQSPEDIERSLEKIRKEEEEKEKLRLESLTTLKFDRTEHDFGTVKQDVDNVTTFKITNTGDKPLIIENVEASCGCTTPKKPEKPILPGKSDVIEVSFKAKPGQTGDQHKTVTVTANTAENIYKLDVKAFVK